MCPGEFLLVPAGKGCLSSVPQQRGDGRGSSLLGQSHDPSSLCTRTWGGVDRVSSGQKPLLQLGKGSTFSLFPPWPGVGLSPFHAWVNAVEKPPCSWAILLNSSRGPGG